MTNEIRECDCEHNQNMNMKCSRNEADKVAETLLAICETLCIPLSIVSDMHKETHYYAIAGMHIHLTFLGRDRINDI